MSCSLENWHIRRLSSCKTRAGAERHHRSVGLTNGKEYELAARPRTADRQTACNVQVCYCSYLVWRLSFLAPLSAAGRSARYTSSSQSDRLAAPATHSIGRSVGRSVGGQQIERSVVRPSVRSLCSSPKNRPPVRPTHFFASPLLSLSLSSPILPPCLSLPFPLASSPPPSSSHLGPSYAGQLLSLFNRSSQQYVQYVAD